MNFSFAADTPSTSFAKNSRTQTLLPSVVQEFHQSPLLEKILTESINKLNGKQTANEPQPSEKCNGERTRDESEGSNGTGSGNDDIEIKSSNEKINEKSETEETRLNYNYAQVFGTDDELLKLVLHEGI